MESTTLVTFKKKLKQNGNLLLPESISESEWVEIKKIGDVDQNIPAFININDDIMHITYIVRLSNPDAFLAAFI